MGGERGGICAEGRRAHHRGTCVVLGVSVPSLHTASRTSPVHVQDSSWEQDHHPLWHCLHSSCCRGPGFKGAHPHPGQHKSCPPAPACQDEGGQFNNKADGVMTTTRLMRTRGMSSTSVADEVLHK